jgi:hypothetical protein
MDRAWQAQTRRVVSAQQAAAAFSTSDDSQRQNGSVMRVHPIAPSELSEEQRPLYRDMRAGIEGSFTGFTAINDDRVEHD